MIQLRNLKRNLAKAITQPGYALKALRQRLLSYLTYTIHDGYSHYPETVDLFLTYMCNLRCKMCGQWGEAGTSKEMSPKELKRELSLDEIYKIINDIKTFKPNVTLFGGEPLMYTNWEKVVSRIKQEGMRCNMITNGILLERYANSIIDLGVDEIIFSLDGPREVHDEVRGAKGTFERASRGLKLIRDIKKKSGASKPVVSISSTIFEINYKRLDELISIAEELAASTITFHHLIFLSEERYNQHNNIFKGFYGMVCSDWKGFVRNSLPDIDVDFLIRKMEDIKKRSSKVKINFYPNFTDEEIRRYYTGFDFVSSGYGKRCLSPWMVSYIFPDGSVRPCQSLNFSAGNVKDSTFSKIWNNEKYMRFRKITKKEKKYPVCTRCTELYRF
ncbi:MAG: radical SAM protein [Candidatus Scalindua sp.]|jgi:radical SAM protein with 4Fe4S-binding SPASM domain|nr:radical SAM protein [Candidatus Scalindua sp.]MBT5304066.1 radical SAM protein [Candidatus Scalindua sp.]MBT6052516.1 radical SAM protein [Candidatus Scalindua sp.]MBT6231140.1 radical SAM protein [Candidatus Scalindua sp.]MBT6562009.1 radical SAM protein [Candidatus Scalindua sp.]